MEISKDKAKIKILKLWEVLQTHSDENNPLSTNELLEYLEWHGISCDRRTLYRDIQTLNDNGLEVLCRKTKTCNLYYVVDRKFDVTELRILLDSVQGAGFITHKKTAELVSKLADLAGKNKADLLKRNVTQFNTTKHSNELIYYNIYAINEAILTQRQISFLYFDYALDGTRKYRKNGKPYVVNPLTTVLSNDNYYLVCSHISFDDFTSYRIDRMSDVLIQKTPAVIPDNLDQTIAQYRKQAFFMFAGSPTAVTFQADNSLSNVIFDKFGEDTLLTDNLDGTFQFACNVEISNMFFGWCCSFGHKLKIIAPDSIKERLQQYIASLYALYES